MQYETFFVGLVVAVLYIEIMDIYPGGIIVPAYIALYLDQPFRALATVLIAFLSLYCYKFLSRYLILFGKRRFVMLVLLGALWTQLWFLVLPHIFPSLHFFAETGMSIISPAINSIKANIL